MELAQEPISLSVSQWEITHPLSLTARISASGSIAAINICLAHLVTTQAGVYVSHIPSLSYSADAGGFSSNCELALYHPGIFGMIGDQCAHKSYVTHLAILRDGAE